MTTGSEKYDEIKIVRKKDMILRQILGKTQFQFLVISYDKFSIITF